VNRRGFSTPELLFVIAIVSVLAALLIPVLASARSKAHATSCLSTIRGLTTALNLYAADAATEQTIGGTEAEGVAWLRTLEPYLERGTKVECPTVSVPAQFSAWNVKGYAINRRLAPDDWLLRREAWGGVRFPSTSVAFTEISFATGSSGSASIQETAEEPQTRPGFPGEKFLGNAGALRHRGGSHYGFIDGHVKWHRPSEVRPNNRGNDGTRPAFAF